MRKTYLSRRQAGGTLGHSGFTPRPGTHTSTYWRGPLQRDVVTILHAQGADFSEIRAPVRCSWVENGVPRRHTIPFEIGFKDGRLPVLVDVHGDAGAQTSDIIRKQDCIEAGLIDLGCSGLWRLKEADIRSGHRLTNARLLISAGSATNAELIACVGALRLLGGVAPAQDLIETTGLAKEPAWYALLRTILAGHLRMSDPNARLNRRAIISF